jgi:hypothetical protein
MGRAIFTLVITIALVTAWGVPFHPLEGTPFVTSSTELVPPFFFFFFVGLGF